MITIINNTVNDVTLGSPISLLNLSNLKNQVDDYETEEINGSEILVTLLINKTDKISLNGKIIDSQTIESFLKEENPLIDDKTYIFPNYNLLFNYDQKRGLFKEICLYHESIKDLMEEFYDCHYLDMLALQEQTITIPKDLILLPFEALGDFSFGMSTELFKEDFPSIVKEFDNGGFADLGDFGIRFDNGQLSQVQLASNIKHYKILLDDVNINSQNGLKEIMTKHPYEEGGDVGRIVFPTLGIATWKNLSSLYFFDESLLSLWLDFDRLITQY